MSDHKALIDSLSADLKPVRRTPNLQLLGLLWLLISAAYVMLVANLLGPIRPDAHSQLLSVPRFTAETALGVVAIALTVACAVRMAVPGALNRKLLVFTLVAVGAWIANYALGIVSPTLAPSMIGKREHCSLETFFYSVPPVLFAWVIARRLYSLQPANTAAAFGLAAGLLPALYMQIACMYEPVHILKFHLAPGLAVGAICFFITLCAIKLGNRRSKP